MRTTTRVGLVAAFAALALILSGCGGGTTSSAPASTRTIDVTMTDNAFQPTQLRVAPNETVTFVFTNSGSVAHEAIIGDQATQDAHHAEMTGSTGKMDHANMAMGSPSAAASGGAITVGPGSTGQLTYTAAGTGTTIIGCHEPGHWEAGMKSTLTIG